MVRSLIILALLVFSSQAAHSAPKKYKDLIRCEISDGYELAVQNKGRGYYLALLYGDKTEYRERLRKPKRMSLLQNRNQFIFELKNPNSNDYLVRISAQFGADAVSFDEVVHYKLLPRPKKIASYKLYEMAGDGFPIKGRGCYRL